LHDHKTHESFTHTPLFFFFRAQLFLRNQLSLLFHYKTKHKNSFQKGKTENQENYEST